MQLKNTISSYGAVTKLLHWLIAVLVLMMLAVGFFMDDLPKEYKGVVYNLHKLTGLTVLFLMLVSIVWSFFNVRPEHPHGMPRWQHYVSRIVQILLSICLIAMPLVGWIGSSSANKAPHIGDLVLKLPISENKELIEQMFDIHETLAIVILILVSVHMLAALYHHYIVKDDVLRRMLPK
jgi:cytochrome b561